MISKRWIAEGATVLEEGGEADNVICYTWGHGKRHFYGGEPPDAPEKRMAEQIADEHNALIELVAALRKIGPLLWSYTATEANGLLDLAELELRYPEMFGISPEYVEMFKEMKEQP